VSLKLEWTLAALLCAAPALAADVEITDSWIRALPAKLPAAGYFTMHNKARNEVSLTGAASPLCGMLMLHRSVDKGGMGSMQDVTGVAVPAGGTLAFAPGGFHLMCMDPAPGLAPGSKAPVSLSFSDGSKETVSFAVKNAQGK
jgi:periplasmic copper chaperone A